MRWQRPHSPSKSRTGRGGVVVPLMPYLGSRHSRSKSKKPGPWRGPGVTTADSTNCPRQAYPSLADRDFAGLECFRFRQGDPEHAVANFRGDSIGIDGVVVIQDKLERHGG
jgi:hypothetical protein